MNIKIIILLISVAFGHLHMVHGSSVKQMDKYYHYVHQANIEISKNNNKKASQYFDSAFSYVQYPFRIDLNNAVYAHIHTLKPDTQKVLLYLEHIQAMKIDLKEKYSNLPEFLAFIEIMDSSSSISSMTNSELIKAIGHAIENDQVLRRFSYDQYQKHYHPSLLTAIDKIDSMNYILMDSVFRKALALGIPLERLTGDKANQSLEVIYIHNAAWDRYDKNLTDSLIILGIIDAREFAYFYDKNCGSFYGEFNPKYNNKWSTEMTGCMDYGGPYGTNIIMQYRDCCAYILALNEQEIKNVNENRKKLFLQDIYEEAKIKIFAYIHQNKGIESPMRSLLSADQNRIIEFEKNILDWRPGYYKYLNTESFDFDKKIITK